MTSGLTYHGRGDVAVLPNEGVCHFCKQPGYVQIRFLCSPILKPDVVFHLCFGHVGLIDKLKEAERVVREFNALPRL